MTTATPPLATTPDRRVVAALVALVAGAIAMGVSPVFVRHADVGPFASAFWRAALALPVLAVWARLERRTDVPLPRWNRATIAAGVLFAGDLFFWHLAIMNTTAANATLLATLAPFWVMLASGALLKEPVTRPMALGLAVCLCGAAMLVGSSFALAPERLDGDFFGLVTSLFFGGYFIAMRFARRGVAGMTPGLLVYRSTLVTAAVLFVAALALEEVLLPSSVKGIAMLVALGIFSHAAGQGLLAYALGTLSAGFSALVIFLEAVAAATMGYVFLGESVSIAQGAGGAVILAGIYIARPRSNAGVAVSRPAHRSRRHLTRKDPR
ncbi:DMT family transporter [Stappia sp.]|uniref:DMT family transporter n=1 Tax=Stappia sp. TaxID=1870903 RepID=UPI003A9975F0